ncbi:hypothetical protein H6G36_16980 [Anabaena minutissima FACHB-250]|nr:hypothetical protein [Anabaena minutissima FACHB-250]
MGLLDAFLLTLINVLACLALPKLLSLILSPPQSKQNHRLPKVAKWRETGRGMTSFPYCTTYTLTGREFCKFSPHFCAKCSPN